MRDRAFEALNAVYLRVKIATVEVVVTEGTGLGARRTARVRSLSEQVESRQQGRIWAGSTCSPRTAPAPCWRDTRSATQALRGDSEIENWYQRFETLNSQFLQTISAWQTSGQDEGVLDKLLKIVSRQVRALGTITETVPRYTRYADRFEHALELVEAGKSEFITSPTADSIHNIWFEFHEDILTLLGRPRLDAESDH